MDDNDDDDDNSKLWSRARTEEKKESVISIQMLCYEIKDTTVARGVAKGLEGGRLND